MNHARRILPCWDEPDRKATFSMIVTVPSEYTVLYNTDALSKSSPSEGLTRHVFGPTPIMSSYLLALFVGEAECLQAVSKSGVQVRVWREVGRSNVGQFELDQAVKCLDFFESFYGARCDNRDSFLLCFLKSCLGMR